ncbi:MAG: 50S ribosomal protein L17 [Holosporales bacterium]|jgi:large subunit ribosomal protein L17|nr:50S ribosomal protein L17 [Holosporales bacterium]
MRHGFAKRRLNRTSSHRKAMLRAMMCSLFEHEQIRTTLPKAKELRPAAEKMITMARKGTLHAKRMAVARLQKESVVKKLFDDIVERFKDRPGGYVRIMKAGFRYGDAAPMAIIELVEKNSVNL